MPRKYIHSSSVRAKHSFNPTIRQRPPEEGVREISVFALKAATIRFTKDEIERIAAEEKVILTVSARNFLSKAAASVIRVGSTEMERVGRLKMSQAGKRTRVLIEPNAGFLAETSKSIQTVIKAAANQTSTGRIAMHDIQGAVTSKWCKVFPICCRRTSFKLGIPLRKTKQ